MNQIYSCGDDNLEVFTTVISSKVCSPSRRRAQHSQQIITKSVALASDCKPYWPEKLLPHQSDLIEVLYKDDEVWRFGCLQNGQQVLFPVKCAAKQRDTGKTRISKFGSKQSTGKSSESKKAQTSSSIHGTVMQSAPDPKTSEDSPFTEQQIDRTHRNAEEDQAPSEEMEAPLLLTGCGVSSGTPSILKKIWLKHKKKAEYLGATNGAFEAD